MINNYGYDQWWTDFFVSFSETIDLKKINVQKNYVHQILNDYYNNNRSNNFVIIVIL